MTDPAPLVPASPILDPAGVPYAPGYGDIYHSDQGGPAQSMHVFLGGNDLPRRWAGRDAFTVLECGFGLGLNFLATWRAWRDDPQAPRRLHYVAAEKHPLVRDDLARLQRWPALADLSARLRALWPPLVPGFHRLHLDDGRCTLTLLLGDAAMQFARLDAAVDALYLDGFAPDRNPDAWSEQVLSECARLCGPGATLATWSVAAAVRTGLERTGWTLHRRTGFGRKRDMLTGVRQGVPVPARAPSARRALVVGAGIAGTNCAARLAVRGWDVAVLEELAAPGLLASGNPAGVVSPQLQSSETPAARLSRAATLYAVRHYDALVAHGAAWQRHGVLRVAPDAAQALRQATQVERLAAPADFVTLLDGSAAAARAGRPVAGPAQWFTHAGTLLPGSACGAALASGAGRIALHAGGGVARLVWQDRGWRALDAAGAVLGEAPVVILANALALGAIDQARHLPLSWTRGQVSILPASAGRTPPVAINGDGYIAPMPDGGCCFGATIQHDDPETAARPSDHVANLARLERLLPGFGHGLDARSLVGRVGFRTGTPDRLPLFGPLSDDADGLLVAAALGGRGLAWAPWGAELIAARLDGDPMPCERDLAAAVDPRRYTGRGAAR